MSYNINALPKEIQQQVKEFIDFLLWKYEYQQKEKVESERMKLYGIFEGKMEISPDFDEPLEDFKEYL